MKTNVADSHTALLLQISQLHKVKQEQEETLKRGIDAWIYTLSPMAVLKNSIKELLDDKTLQKNLVRVSVKVGVGLIVQKIIRKNNSLSEIVSAVVADKLGTLFTGENYSSILTAIGNLLNPHPQETK